MFQTLGLGKISVALTWTSHKNQLGSSPFTSVSNTHLIDLFWSYVDAFHKS